MYHKKKNMAMGGMNMPRVMKKEMPGGGMISPMEMGMGGKMDYEMGGKMDMGHGGDMARAIKIYLMRKGGKTFPDLTGDGKVTFADILKGRKVKLKKKSQAYGGKVMENGGKSPDFLMSGGDQGLASSATPGGGATITLGEGSPVDFGTVVKSFAQNNRDLVDPSKGFYMVGDEKVFFDSGDKGQFEERVVRPAFQKDVAQVEGDTFGEVYRGLMSEFDKYVSSFGDELKNDPAQIRRMREKFRERASNFAGQIEDSRFDYRP